jgi:hypothetical protein
MPTLRVVIRPARGTLGRVRRPLEEYQSISESPEEIPERGRARAAASPKHPDDSLAPIENRALARSGCQPGVRTHPWMGCDVAEERAPG